ncbi:MAG: shikimate dehydrogenase [Methanomassiliicoccaceae archaeon]|nr:shikimate dehydrogenase [Methanomassiliicoccaceae archaeon]
MPRTHLCASLSSVEDRDHIEKADIAEVRLDILGRVPEIGGKKIIATFRDVPDLSVLPKGFKGMIDIGEHDVPDTDAEVISSHHNYDSTPPAKEIADLLKNMKGDIVKGAFRVNSFSDLKTLYDVSRSIEKRHVLLGMGELGAVTRIRSGTLGNEFTFAYVGTPTAPGQLSLEEMSYLGDDPMVAGIVGHPLEKSLSPMMHNEVMSKIGFKGVYLKFDSESLEHVEDVIRAYNIKGLNVTIPYKSTILGHLDSVDKDAEAVGAANTVVNDNGKLKGYNTDIIGIENAVKLAGFDPKGKRALIMGSGGAARACAFALKEKGCRVTVTGRNEETSRSLCKDLGCDLQPKDSVALMLHDLIVNCTPIGMYGSGEYPVSICQLTPHHTVFDMVYGTETPLISKAKETGAGIVSGEDMLAAQGAASLGMWTGKKDLFKLMREALN